MIEPLVEESCGKRKRRKVVSTVKKAAHHPCAIAYKVSSVESEYDMPVQWIYGRECVKDFVAVMKEIHEQAAPILSPNTPPHPMCAAQRKSLKEKQTCYLCGDWMLGKKDLDHDHRTGEVGSLVVLKFLFKAVNVSGGLLSTLNMVKFFLCQKLIPYHPPDTWIRTPRV